MGAIARAPAYGTPPAAQDRRPNGASAAAPSVPIASTITASALDHFVRPDLAPGIEPDYRLPPFHNARLLRFRYNPLHNWVIRRQLARFATARTCVSDAQRRALEANGIPPLRVVYNGVDPAELVASLRTDGVEADYIPEVDRIVEKVAGSVSPGDVLLVMSNGGFGGIHEKLLAALR